MLTCMNAASTYLIVKSNNARLGKHNQHRHNQPQATASAPHTTSKPKVCRYKLTHLYMQNSEMSIILPGVL